MDTLGVCTSRNVRTVSLVVTVIDDFTGQPVCGSNARVWIENEKPPIKKTEGWNVFLNLSDGEYIVKASGGTYNQSECSCVVKTGKPAMLKIRLTPNSSYPIPSGTTCIEGTAELNALVRVYSSDKTAAFKLLSDVKKGGAEIGIYHTDGFEAEGKLFRIISPDKKEEFIRVSGTENKERSFYRLSEPLKNSYPKIGTLIIPVNEAVADGEGKFFIPIRNTFKESCEYICMATKSKEISVAAEIPSGRRTQINLTENQN